LQNCDVHCTPPRSSASAPVPDRAVDQDRQRAVTPRVKNAVRNQAGAAADLSFAWAGIGRAIEAVRCNPDAGCTAVTPVWDQQRRRIPESFARA
jgi:hypothetical protein